MRKLFRIFSIIVSSLLILISSHPQITSAASISSLSDTPSNGTARATGATHLIVFTTETTQTLRRITIQFSNTAVAGSKPTHLDLSTISLGSITGLAEAWTLATNNLSTGGINVNFVDGELVPSNTEITIPIQNVTNSAIDDCQPENTTLTDTCYVRISTFSDEGGTLVDSGTTSYTVEEEHWMSFAIESVSSGTTTNGITTNLSSTNTTLPFANLRPSIPKYVAQKLTISTNAPKGYIVTTVLAEPLEGVNGAGEISPFAAPDTTWNTPQDWSSPVTVLPGDETGWIGANTTDTRVYGWDGNTSGKFGPISHIPRTVAISDGPDRAGTEVYVTYAVEINSAQPSDYYTGRIMYNVQTIY